jgi:hypothetical protein
LAREQEDAFPAFEALMVDLQREETAEPDEDGDDSDEGDELRADAPLDAEREIAPPHVHVQSLMEEFRRRQRHASMLVAGSIATAAVLTVGGLVLIASLSVPPPVDGDNRPVTRSTSVAWQPPAIVRNAGIQLAAIATNRAAKGEPLLAPGASAASSGSSLQGNTILAASGRQIAFGPLLPPSSAGYFMVRGLPLAAKLSAGRQSESGTWMMKAQHVNKLSLQLGEVPAGDYPIEVYVLQSGDAPQARRSFVLRVEPPARTYAVARSDMSWAQALLDLVPAAHAAEAPAAPVEVSLVRDRAQRLLEEGDIASARLLLLYLAERGEGEAAYQLARTYDREVLDDLGAKGITGDLASARSWYERAARSGNAKATERLRILASLSSETGAAD